MAECPDEDLLRATLAAVAPGTDLRDGLERILRGRTGALVVLGSDRTVESICSGGFELDVEFSATRLRELAKMDGAIVLNREGTRILRAATQLVPDPSIETVESGTRHRTAERVAKQTHLPVISVSPSMSIVALYAARCATSWRPGPRSWRRPTRRCRRRSAVVTAASDFWHALPGRGPSRTGHRPADLMDELDASAASLWRAFTRGQAARDEQGDMTYIADVFDRATQLVRKYPLAPPLAWTSQPVETKDEKWLSYVSVKDDGRVVVAGGARRRRSGCRVGQPRRSSSTA